MSTCTADVVQTSRELFLKLKFREVVDEALHDEVRKVK